MPVVTRRQDVHNPFPQGWVHLEVEVYQQTYVLVLYITIDMGEAKMFPHMMDLQQNPSQYLQGRPISTGHGRFSLVKDRLSALESSNHALLSEKRIS